MTYPNVHEIRSTRRSSGLPGFAPLPVTYFDGQTHAQAIHGYRERAAQLRAMDAQHCDAHGASVIYCGCQS